MNNGINLGICGGTIINKLYILTAGHCFFNKTGDHVELFDVDKTFVLVGKHSFHGVPDSQVTRFSVRLPNQLLSTGLEPVLSHTEKAFIASYYKLFSTYIKIKS